MPLPEPPTADHPDPDDIEGEVLIDELVALLETQLFDDARQEVGATDSVLHWKLTSEAYHKTKKFTGDLPPKRIKWSAQRRLVAMLNVLGSDVERFLSTDDHYVEARILYERVLEAKTEWAENGGGDKLVNCDCREEFWTVEKVAEGDGDLDVWEHECRWCGKTNRMAAERKPPEGSWRLQKWRRREKV